MKRAGILICVAYGCAVGIGLIWGLQAGVYAAVGITFAGVMGYIRED